MHLTPDKKLHSREHVLAEDLSQALAEPKRFAAYLGIAKHYHESDLRALARYAVEKKDLPVEARGKYFFASLKGLIKKRHVKHSAFNIKKNHGEKRTKNNGNRQRVRKGSAQESR